MSENLVLYNPKDHIGYITLNNPQNGNRIDLAAAQELIEACHRANGDEEVYVVVLSGAGNCFCAGGDARGLISPGDGENLPVKYSPAEAVAGIDRPVIAAIQGEASGEGLEIALACDMRIAADNARFGLPQVTDGVIPMDGGTQRLSRIAGKGKALEMVLTGAVIDSREALEIGLVNKIVSAESLTAEVDTLAQSLAAKAPLAMRYAKEAVNKGLDLTLEQGLRLEADLYFLLHTTADRTEGIKSFLEKRKPQYKGK
jgi:enoyl-CoA hydratase/carnithine racemase